jgi:exodeoxyribonuclease VII large subunit
LLVPDRVELQSQVRQLRGRLDAALQRRLGALSQRADVAALRLQSLHPQLRLERVGNRLALLEQRLRNGMHRDMERRATRLEGLGRALASVSPLATIGRGYTVLRDSDSGALLRRAIDATPGQALDAQLAEGRLRVVVKEQLPPA